MQLNFENIQPLLAEILDIGVADLQPSTILNGSEKWDSFAMLSAVALATEHTGRQLTLHDVSKLKTVANFVELLQKLRSS